MFVKRVSVVVLIFSALLFAGRVARRVTGAAQALPTAQEADPSQVTIPYPGRLHDDAGQPVTDGTYDFAFTVYSAASGGELLWSELQKGVSVEDGTFNVVLGSVNAIPVETLQGKEQWLAVAVRGPDDTTFTDLTPRQRLSAASPASLAVLAAPSNGSSCPHSHWGETWEGDSGFLSLHSTATGNEVWLPGPFSGLYAQSDAWAGVHGQSTSNIGVYGQSTDSYGVVGQSANGFGGFFHSTGNDHYDLALGGAFGRVNTDPDDPNSLLYLSSNADVIVKLDNDGGENHAFHIRNSSNADLCYTEETTGDWNCTGNKNAVVETENYGWRKLHAMESPEVWFEDFGTASLVDGKVTVVFDPIFAETANMQVEYHVFVTPIGQEPVLLFVTDKSAAAFTVEGVTLDGKPAESDFDYRIAVKRLGYEDARLEETTWQEGE